MKPKRWEVFLILALVLGLTAWALWPKSSGSMVTVTVDGTETGTYPLDQNLQMSIGGYGSFSLTLFIEGGQARVENSTCPDLICQHHSPISKAGEQIICLPARIVITVTGEGEAPDAIAG